MSDGSAVGLRIPGLRQRPGEFSIPQKSTRHASQGRPAGMARSAKNGFAIHRAEAAAEDGDRRSVRNRVRQNNKARASVTTVHLKTVLTSHKRRTDAELDQEVSQAQHECLFDGALV